MSDTEPKRGPGRQESAMTESPEDAAESLIDLLRARTAPILGGLLGDALDRLPSTLSDVDPRYATGTMSYPHEEIIEHVAQKRGEAEDAFAQYLVKTYEAEVDRGEAIDLDRLSVQPTEELEERIAQGSLADRIEQTFSDNLVDLRARITYMIRYLGLAISRRALSPVVILNAIADSLIRLDLPLQARLLMYRQFDAEFVPRLGEVYTAAIRFLDEEKIDPAEAEAAEENLLQAEPPTDHASDGPISPKFSAPALDSKTLQALKSIASAPPASIAGDAEFASELLDFATADAPTIEHVATAQRLSLVGQMCNEIISDPHLPQSMHPLFERLRFPLTKIALADSTFFANRSHPVRRLVAEAAETAASSRIANKVVVRRLEERLTQIAEQANLSASFVRPQISRLKPLGMMQIAAFLDQQREESESRRDSVLNKVRRVVTLEMDMHSMGRSPSPAMTSFLRMGWGPLLSARLLRNGINSPEWIDGIDRLVKLIASMDPRKISSGQNFSRDKMRVSISIDLKSVGMRAERVATVLNHIDQAWKDVDAELANMSQAERDAPENELELLSPMETARVMGGMSGTSPAKVEPKPKGAKRAENDLLEFDLSQANSLLESDARVAQDKGYVEEDLSFEMQAPTARSPEPESESDLATASDAPGTNAIEAGETPATPKSDTLDPDEIVRETPVSLASMRRSLSRDASKGAMPEDLSKADEMELLSFCLTAETWYRVFDARNGQTLWLKVSSYYPEHGSVGFNGFDAKKTLSMRTNKLLNDLIAGRSEPVNPTPVQAKVIAELRSRQARA